MNAYYGLSPKQKEDFWRIYAAEAYACGVFYAFHLKTAMPGEPTARDSGVLEFLKRYSQFYADRAALFIGAKPLPARPVTRVAKLTATLSEVAGKTLLHLVNHNYASTLIPQADFSVSLPLTTAPQRVVLHTPDAPSSRELAFSYANGQLTVQVDRLESYDLIVIE